MKQLKATVTRKGQGHQRQPDQQDAAYLDELAHLIHGYQKKGDNLKLMVQKLNEHDHKRPDGSDWDYTSLQNTIKELKL